MHDFEASAGGVEHHEVVDNAPRDDEAIGAGFDDKGGDGRNRERNDQRRGRALARPAFPRDRAADVLDRRAHKGDAALRPAARVSHAAPVVADFDHGLIGLGAGGHKDAPGFGLAEPAPFLGRLDRLVDRVSNELGQGFANGAKHLAVEHRVAAFERHLDLPSQVLGDVERQPLLVGEQASDRLQSGGQRLGLEFAGDRRQPSQRLAQRRDLLTGGDQQQPVLRHDQVGDQRIDALDRLERDAEVVDAPFRRRRGLIHRGFQ